MTVLSSISIVHYASLSTMVFMVAVVGVFVNRKNLIALLMCLELMLLAVVINFVSFGAYWGDLFGQVFALFVLTVAAAEVAIGLAIIIAWFRLKGSIAVQEISDLKG